MAFQKEKPRNRIHRIYARNKNRALEPDETFTTTNIFGLQHVSL